MSTIVQAVAAMRTATAVNTAKYEQKAVYLDYAVVATLAATLIALIGQVLVTLRIVMMP